MTNGRNINTLLVCLTSIVIVTIGALVAIFIASQSTNDALARAGIVTGFVGILIPQYLLLAKQDKVSEAVEEVKATTESVKDDTNKIMNGEGQAAIKAAVHKVLDERGLGETS